MQELDSQLAAKRRAAAVALVPLALAAVFATPVVAYANPEDVTDQVSEAVRACSATEPAYVSGNLAEDIGRPAGGKHFASTPDSEVSPGTAAEGVAGGRLQVSRRRAKMMTRLRSRWHLCRETRAAIRAIKLAASLMVR